MFNNSDGRTTLSVIPPFESIVVNTDEDLNKHA